VGSKSTMQVRTLARGLSIMETLKDRGPSSLTEIAGEVNIDKSTVLRLLDTFGDFGFVERDPETKKYRLGLPLIMYGRRVASDLQLRRVALPYLERLQQTSRETVNLSTLYEGMVVWVVNLYSQSPDRISLPRGIRTSFAHSTGAGKAMLAYLSDKELENIYQTLGFPAQTENTLVTLEDLREDLHRTRQRGYSVSKGENIRGLCCIGAAVFGHEDQVLGAVSIAFPVNRFSEDTFLPLIPQLRRTCQNISRAMGASERTLLRVLGTT
jgi:IclR family KDG regulon transcriptional repressor